MNWSAYRSPVFADADGSAVNCDLVLVNGSTIPFTARGDDPELMGRCVYQAIMENQFTCPISPYEVLT